MGQSVRELSPQAVKEPRPRAHQVDEAGRGVGDLGHAALRRRGGGQQHQLDAVARRDLARLLRLLERDVRDQEACGEVGADFSRQSDEPAQQ